MKVSASGKLVEESNPSTKLTRTLVDALLELREDHGASYTALTAWLADFHGVVVSRSLVQQICNYRWWVTPVADVRRVMEPGALPGGKRKADGKFAGDRNAGRSTRIPRRGEKRK